MLNKYSKTILETAAKWVGIDRLVTGTDVPIPDQHLTRDMLEELPFSPQIKRDISFNNAARLFDHHGNHRPIER